MSWHHHSFIVHPSICSIPCCPRRCPRHCLSDRKKRNRKDAILPHLNHAHRSACSTVTSLAGVGGERRVGGRAHQGWAGGMYSCLASSMGRTLCIPHSPFDLPFLPLSIGIRSSISERNCASRSSSEFLSSFHGSFVILHLFVQGWVKCLVASYQPNVVCISRKKEKERDDLWAR